MQIWKISCRAKIFDRYKDALYKKSVRFRNQCYEDCMEINLWRLYVKYVRRENIFPDALYLSMLQVRSDHHGFPVGVSERSYTREGENHALCYYNRTIIGTNARRYTCTRVCTRVRNTAHRHHRARSFAM